MKRQVSSSTPGNNDVESYWRNQIKTEEKIEKLSNLVENLAQKNNIMTPSSDRSNTGVLKNIIPLSGKFLSLIMPSITPSQIENNGIFDLHIFDMNTRYSTYEDAKIGLKISTINMPYDTFLKNIKAIGPTVYSINETRAFPFRSFYLNPPKSDTQVRLTLEIESQTITLEIPKTKYAELRDLLMSKNRSPIVTPKKK